MSSFMTIAATSQALRDILWQAYAIDPLISTVVNSPMDISFTNPTETARDSSRRLSLWLYQVEENEHLRNQPAARWNGHNSVLDTPLSLNLYYLVTPFSPSGEFDHYLLGLTMQVMYENAVLWVRRPEDSVFDEVRPTLCRLTLEEQTRIWEALREPYRLSISYQVRVVRIDSRLVSDKARVVELEGGYGLVPPEGERR